MLPTLTVIVADAVDGGVEAEDVVRAHGVLPGRNLVPPALHTQLTNVCIKLGIDQNKGFFMKTALDFASNRSW